MATSDDRNDIQTAPHHRRASFSPGTTLSELFTGRSVPVPYPGPNVAAAQRNRRVSISTGSPSTASSFSSFRRGSVSSISSSASGFDEAAVEEGDSSIPSSPFARRMSFGARALRDFRLPVSRVSHPQSPVTTPSARAGQWIDGPKSSSPPLTQPGDNPHHQRRPSVSTMPLPVSATKQTLDDPLQERILKGDFYMD